MNIKRFDIIMAVIIFSIVVGWTYYGVKKECGKDKMSVEEVIGMDGHVINVESGEDLFQALDALFMQVHRNIGEDSPFLKVLNNTMKTLEKEHGVEPTYH